MKLIKKILHIVIVISLVTATYTVYAQTPTTPGGDIGGTRKDSVDTGTKKVTTTTTSGGKIGLENPLKVKNISALIKASVDIMIFIGTIIAMLALIWAGFQFVLSRGNPEKLAEVKRWFMYIIIGAGILFASRIIITLIQETVNSTGLVDPNLFK